MIGADVIEALTRKLQKDRGGTPLTQRELARFLGISGFHLNQNWLKANARTPLQVANLLISAIKAAERRVQETAIRPIVEFFPLEGEPTAHSKKPRLFNAGSRTGLDPRYLQGLREELRTNHGIYIFYDSRGAALYAGKAKRLSLWVEMNGAFNRKRPVGQSLYRVRHPQPQQAYKTSAEKARQITRVGVPLHELAAYFSAYEVPDAMIDSLEALLVRGFANDLLNVRMEKFAAGKGKPR